VRLEHLQQSTAPHRRADGCPGCTMASGAGVHDGYRWPQYRSANYSIILSRGG
jgi:hypothetical protein